MAQTPSTMLPLGTKAPDFALPDPSGQIHKLADFADRRALVVIFLCNHCPFVKYVADGLAQFARDYARRGVGIVGISANDVETHPDDSPARMAEESRRRGYEFPYLYDESQAVAQAYRAACTPDLYLFDASQRLVYRGQFDSSRPSNSIPVTGEDLRTAVDQLLTSGTVLIEQRPSIGCNIKWKPGNEPKY